MSYVISMNRSLFRFSYEKEYPNVPYVGTKKYHNNAKSSTEAAKKRSRKAKRRLKDALLSIKSTPEYFLTFTYDTNKYQLMRAKYGIVNDCAWNTLQNHKKKLNEVVVKEFPTGWALWVVEVGGNKNVIHIHYYLRTNDKTSLESVVAWAEDIWSELTGCVDERCIDVQKVWETNGIKLYTFKGKKVSYQYPLHPHDKEAKKRRKTWGKINKKNMVFHKEDRGVIIEDHVMQEIKQALIKDYRAYCAERDLPVNKRHIRRLRESNGYCHIFNNRRQWKIMIKILASHGITLEQAPRKAGKKRK